MPSAKPESIDCVMSSSPTRLMMLSTFSVATRMEPDSADAFCAGAPAGAVRSASAGDTALVSAADAGGFVSVGDTALVSGDDASTAACGAPGRGAPGAE